MTQEEAVDEQRVKENALYDIRLIVERGHGLGHKYAKLLLAEMDRSATREAMAKADVWEEVLAHEQIFAQEPAVHIRVDCCRAREMACARGNIAWIKGRIAALRAAAGRKA